MSGDGGCCKLKGVEQRYHSLRAQLDELGFRQPLVIECLPLVEALFGDLLQTTSSLDHYKKKAHELDEQVRVLNRGVQPFRNDNERLVRQITELNQQVTLIREEANNSVLDAKARCRKLEQENGDLQFLVSQHLARIRSLEVESADKTKKLLQLQSAPSVSLGKKKIAQTKVEILSSVGPTKKQPPGRPWLDVFSGALTQTEDPFVVNMVDRSQAELRACRYEMKLLREESEKLNQTISSLKQQVRDRDLDIAKLHTQLDSCKSHASARDPEVMRDDYTIANLRAAIGSLEDSNQSLRSQLQDALRKQHEAMMRAVRLAERNQVLQAEIRNVDNVAMRVEDSCNYTVKETAQRIIELQEQLTQSQKMVAELERSGVEARCNVQNLLMDLEKLRLENKQLLETQRLSNAQTHLQADRVELSRYQHVEAELTKEIENLVAAVTYQKQKIAELEEKVASGPSHSRPNGDIRSDKGTGSGTSKGSTSSGSGRSNQTTGYLKNQTLLNTPKSSSFASSRFSSTKRNSCTSPTLVVSSSVLNSDETGHILPKGKGVMFPYSSASSTRSGTDITRDSECVSKRPTFIDVESSLSRLSSQSASEPFESISLRSPGSQKASEFTSSSGQATKSTLSVLMSSERLSASTDGPTPTSHTTTTTTIDEPPENKIKENIPCFDERGIKVCGELGRLPRTEGQDQYTHTQFSEEHNVFPRAPRGRTPRQLTTISSLTADWELHSRPHLVVRHMATSPEFIPHPCTLSTKTHSEATSASPSSQSFSSSGTESTCNPEAKCQSASYSSESDTTVGTQDHDDTRGKKKVSVSKKAGATSGPSKNSNGDSTKVRPTNRSAAIQTDVKRIDSKETQVNLPRETCHEPAERENTNKPERRGSRQTDHPYSDCSEGPGKHRNNQDDQNVDGRRQGDKYREAEYRKERRREHHKTRRDEEVEEYISERFAEEDSERWSQDQGRDQDRRSKDNARGKKHDDHVSDRSQPNQKVDRGIQSEVGLSYAHNNPCMDGAGDGPWNVRGKSAAANLCEKRKHGSSCNRGSSSSGSSNGRSRISMISNDYSYYISGYKNCHKYRKKEPRN